MFFLTYDDGDFIAEFKNFDDVYAKALQLQPNQFDEDEKIIKARCSRIYTSSYSRIKMFEEEFSCVPISIAGRCDEKYTGLEYKKLAPKWKFWKEWEETRDNDFYISHYKSEVLDTLNPEKVLLDLTILAKGKDIALLCYEDIGEFCHRHLVAKWLNENIKDYGWMKIIELVA